jgi:hypothetical protein
MAVYFECCSKWETSAKEPRPAWHGGKSWQRKQVMSSAAELIHQYKVAKKEGDRGVTGSAMSGGAETAASRVDSAPALDSLTTLSSMETLQDR